MPLNTFQWFRICFSLYLSFTWLSCIPLGHELFSALIPVGSDVLGFYNFLAESEYINFYFYSLSALSLLICFPKTTLISSLILLANWFYFFNFLPPFSSPPSVAFVGWVLCWFCLNPQSIKLNYSEKMVWWLVTSFAFFASGYNKLISPSWQNGEALMLLANSPYTTGLFKSLTEFPLLLKSLTYLTLAIEIGMFLLVWHKTSRKIAWFCLLNLGLGIVSFMNIPDIGLFFVILSLALLEENHE